MPANSWGSRRLAAGWGCTKHRASGDPFDGASEVPKSPATVGRGRGRAADSCAARRVPADADQAQLLFILLAHRYTRGGLIVTSNLEFADWTAVFNDDARLTAALLDRLTHRCHLLQFRGDSYRFRESLAARGPADDPRPRGRRTTTPPVAPIEEDPIPEA